MGGAETEGINKTKSGNGATSRLLEESQGRCDVMQPVGPAYTRSISPLYAYMLLSKARDG